MTTAAVLFHRFGPYHVARLSAAGRRQPGRVVGIEVSATTTEYAWDVVPGGDDFRRTTVVLNDHAIPPNELSGRIVETLEDIRPDVLFVNGWTGATSMTSLRWATYTKTPAVVMSESTAHDEPRQMWKEAVKRRFVGLFSAALVGGTRHAEYLESLGVPADRVFRGYDAVDNGHFAAGADTARGEADLTRARYGLPAKYFLASSRFIRKKNLPVLLAAFAAYRKCVGTTAWDLVLLGDGPLRQQVEKTRSDLGLDGCVHMPGFKQYHDLPAYYALAGAFVHTSTSEQWGLVVNEAMAAGLPVIVSDRCGCTADLIQDGVNGYPFTPSDIDQLSSLLFKVADDAALRLRMGQASRQIVADWSPERFASGFWAAARRAIEVGPRRPGPLTRSLLSVYTRLSPY